MQRRRLRTEAALATQLQVSGRSLATALPEDVVAVLVDFSARGKTGSSDGALNGVAATQALQNILGDLRQQFDRERDSRAWIASCSQGNPARSSAVDAYVAGYAKLLLASGVVPKAAPAMTREDMRAWVDAAAAVLATERTPAGRLRAHRNHSFGLVLQALGVRKVDVLRLRWEGLVEAEGNLVLLLLPAKPEIRAAARRRARRQEAVLRRAASGSEQRCDCLGAKRWRGHDERERDGRCNCSDCRPAFRSDDSACSPSPLRRYCAVAALEAFGRELEVQRYPLTGLVFAGSWKRSGINERCEERGTSRGGGPYVLATSRIAESGTE